MNDSGDSDSTARRSFITCKLAIFVVGGLVLLAALLRLPPLFNDLWLDEIWSWNVGTNATGWWQIVAGYPESNNHILNTLILRAWGDVEGTAWLRMHSFLFGLAGVPLSAFATFRLAKSYAAAVTAALLVAASLLQVVYSTEARGYEAMFVCSLVAFCLFRPGGDRPSLLVSLLFQSACIAGVLFHASFLQFWLALLVYQVFVVVSGGSSRAKALSHLAAVMSGVARWHLIFIAFLGGYHFVFLRKLVLGAAGYQSYVEAAGVAAGWTLNLPAGLFAPTVSLVLLGGGAVAGIMVLWRSGRRASAVFLVAVIFFVPAVFFVIRPPWANTTEPLLSLMPQHFFLSCAFALLSTAVALGALLATGQRGLAGALLALFLVGAWMSLEPFYRFGRGNSQAVLEHIVDGSPITGTIYLGGNEATRTATHFGFYIDRFPESSRSRLKVTRPESWALQPPDWLIPMHDEIRPEHFEAIGMTDQRDGSVLATYRFEKVFPCGGVNGWHSFLFKRDS
ncbi:MAG: hypothetical protein AAGA58_18455 [Verrucomicrobiota bacterium]